MNQSLHIDVNVEDKFYMNEKSVLLYFDLLFKNQSIKSIEDRLLFSFKQSIELFD
jgi:hypothetical protein